MDEIRENRKNEQRALTREELDRILDAPDPQTRAGIRDRAILELLGGAGLKVQELVPLRVENIDLQISCVLLPENPENPENPERPLLSVLSAEEVLKEEDMKEVGEIIAMVLEDVENESVKEEARKRVAALCEKYPLYE